MATYSTLTIINKALVLCGAATVTAITADTPNARALNTIYDISRKSIMSEEPWSFAITRSTLVTASSVSLYPWKHDDEGTTDAYVYDRPTDALQIVELSDPGAVFREEGAYIISDTLALGVKYIWDNDDASIYTPFFVEAFIDKLCCDISYQIVNDIKKAMAFGEKYEKVTLPRARKNNVEHSTVTTFSTTNSTTINKALLLCGVQNVYDMMQDPKRASAMNSIYNIARRSMLSETPWTFAITRSTLATNSTASLIPWDYEEEGSSNVYDMPSDAIRIVGVSDKSAVWKVENDYIISDTNDLGIKYVYDVVDVAKWSAPFVKAFVDRLCADICFLILNDAKRGAIFQAKYEKFSLPTAITTDQQTGTPLAPVDDAWTDSKYSNSGGDPSRSYS